MIESQVTRSIFSIAEGGSVRGLYARTSTAMPLLLEQFPLVWSILALVYATGALESTEILPENLRLVEHIRLVHHR